MDSSAEGEGRSRAPRLIAERRLAASSPFYFRGMMPNDRCWVKSAAAPLLSLASHLQQIMLRSDRMERYLLKSSGKIQAKTPQEVKTIE